MKDRPPAGGLPAGSCFFPLEEMSRGAAVDVRTLLGRPAPPDRPTTRAAQLLDVTSEELLDVFDSVLARRGER